MQTSKCSQYAWRWLVSGVLVAVGMLPFGSNKVTGEALPAAPQAQPLPPEPDEGPAAATERLREGTRLGDLVGYFKPTGDRLMFYSLDGSRRLRTLENLNLERIASRVSDSPDRLEWTVSGVVTEYQGANYLLVSQATLRARPLADTR